MAQANTDQGLMPQGMVALVDDEVQIVQALKALLSFKGVAASVHESAESLLAALTQRDGQLWLADADGEPTRLGAVVLDLNLPGMNGADLAAELHRLRPQLPIVMITAALDEKLLARVQAMPDVTLLSKPFTLESLEQALQVT
jgi:FixJ family two-component response regulator